jgi:hypothetical protein
MPPASLPSRGLAGIARTRIFAWRRAESFADREHNITSTAAGHIDPCRSDDSAESREVIESTSCRGPSVLRRRADAARRACSRADALVSLAQGYLRGDRPQRSPIEITLTVAGSSLRAGVVDPLEVRRIGRYPRQ